MSNIRQVFLSIPILLFLVANCFAETQGIPQAAQFDEEHIVDVSKLKEKMLESAKPLQEKIEKNQLQEKFDAVFKVLEEKEVDNTKLKAALEDLEQGIDSFRSDWDNTVEPLWKAQATVAQTIDKVRSILASSQASPAELKHDKELEPYESRLKTLAKEIIDEPDPQRKERLKLLFQNLYNLKRIKSIKVNLKPATQLLLSRMIEGLDRLELQFTRIIFSAEESFAILGNQQNFLKDYIQVVKGLIELEDLAGWLAGSGTSGGAGTVEGLLQQFQGLNESVSQLESQLNEHSENLIEKIEKHSEQIETNLQGVSPVSATTATDIDNLINQYAGKED